MNTLVCEFPHISCHEGAEPACHQWLSHSGGCSGSHTTVWPCCMTVVSSSQYVCSLLNFTSSSNSTHVFEAVWGMLFTGYPCNNLCFSLIYTWSLFHQQPYHLHVPIVLQSGSLSLLEASGPVMGLLYLLPFPSKLSACWYLDSGARCGRNCLVNHVFKNSELISVWLSVETFSLGQKLSLLCGINLVIADPVWPKIRHLVLLSFWYTWISLVNTRHTL